MMPVVSILTPTWNRGPYLQRVWEGLNAQSFRKFEWIVANDGSQDDTVEIIRNLAKQSDFPVTLISASQRVGKSRIDNEAVKAARGDFILWCDSDDVLLPGALQVLLRTWDSIPSEDQENFCGISALCDTENGVLGSRFYTSEEPIDMSWNELFNKLRSDLVIFTRADLVKKNPFLEVDFLISESSVWSKIGVLKTRFIPVILERKYYGEVNALSYSGHMSYNRGHAYAVAMTNETTKTFLSAAQWLKRAINYLRYCRHGDIPLFQAFELWGGGTRGRFVLITLWPISQLLALKDSLQGKVRKTHLEFLVAQEHAAVTSERLNFVE